MSVNPDLVRMVEPVKMESTHSLAHVNLDLLGKHVRQVSPTKLFYQQHCFATILVLETHFCYFHDTI